MEQLTKSKYYYEIVWSSDYEGIFCAHNSFWGTPEEAMRRCEWVKENCGYVEELLCASNEGMRKLVELGCEEAGNLEDWPEDEEEYALARNIHYEF